MVQRAERVVHLLAHHRMVSLFGCCDGSDCTSQRCWEPKARAVLSPMRLNFLSDDIDRGGNAGVVITHEESFKKNQVLSVLR